MMKVDFCHFIDFMLCHSCWCFSLFLTSRRSVCCFHCGRNVKMGIAGMLPERVFTLRFLKSCCRCGVLGLLHLLTMWLELSKSMFYVKAFTPTKHHSYGSRIYGVNMCVTMLR